MPFCIQLEAQASPGYAGDLEREQREELQEVIPKLEGGSI